LFPRSNTLCKTDERFASIVRPYKEWPVLSDVVIVFDVLIKDSLMIVVRLKRKECIFVISSS
jgi:hypothetical protein